MARYGGDYWRRFWNQRMGRRRFMRGAAVGGLSFAAASVLGCGEDEGGEAPTTAPTATAPGVQATGTATATAAAGQPRFGGEMVQAEATPVRDFDPHRAITDHYRGGWGMITAGSLLLEMGAKDFKVYPNLIESWEIPGPEAYILKIRPDVKWHNKPPVAGRQFDAEDVVYNLMRNAAKLPGDSLVERPRASATTGMERAEVVDDLTVRLVMTSPNANLVAGLTDERFLLAPREMPGELGFDADPSTFPGVGGFVVEKYDNGVEAVFSKFADHWRKDAQGQRLPYLDRMRFVWIRDRASTLSAFIAGQIHYVSPTTPEEIDLIKRQAPQAQMVIIPHSCREFYRLNVQRKPFDDPRVWQAFHLALDYKRLNDTVWGEGLWKYEGALNTDFPGAYTQEELLQRPGWNPNTKKQDQERAKQILAETGFPEGDGLSFNIVPYQNTGAGMDAVLDIQAQLTSIFPKMKTEVKPPPDAATFQRWQAEGDFDTMFYIICPQIDSALELHNGYHSKGSRNYARYSNPKLDSIIEAAVGEFDEQKRLRLLKEAQDLIYAEGYHILWTSSRHRIHALHPKLGGAEQFFGPALCNCNQMRVFSDRFWLSA